METEKKFFLVAWDGNSFTPGRLLGIMFKETIYRHNFMVVRKFEEKESDNVYFPSILESGTFLRYRVQVQGQTTTWRRSSSIRKLKSKRLNKLPEFTEWVRGEV